MKMLTDLFGYLIKCNVIFIINTILREFYIFNAFVELFLL